MCRVISTASAPVSIASNRSWRETVAQYRAAWLSICSTGPPLKRVRSIQFGKGLVERAERQVASFARNFQDQAIRETH